MTGLTVGTRVAAVFTHVEFSGNECCGYCQLCDSATVDDLSEKVEISVEKAPYVSSLSRGDIVLALYSEDGVWYRARIESVDGGVASVFFIDYGNKEKINNSNIKVAIGELLTIEGLATKCELVDILPNGNRWTDSETEQLHAQLVGFEFTVEVLGSSKSTSQNGVALRLYSDTGHFKHGKEQAAKVRSMKSSPVIELQVGMQYNAYLSYVDSANKFWIQLVDQEHELNDLMTSLADSAASGAEKLDNVSAGKLCMAFYSEDQAPYRSSILTVNGNTTLVQFVDYGNSESKGVSELMKLPQHFQGLPAMSIKCCYKRTKVDNNTLEEKLQELTESDGVLVRVLGRTDDVYNVEIDKIENISSASASPQVNGQHFIPMELDSTKVYDVCLSYVEHPGKFFVQLLENGPELDQVMVKLTREFNFNTTAPSLSAGIACIGQLSDDQHYRCVIKSVSGENARVHAVDFGFIENVTVNRLRAMSPIFLDVPCYATECTVDVTKTQDKFWSSTEIDTLKSFESQVSLVAKVTTRRNNLYQLDLYDTRDRDEDRYINAEMLGVGKSAQKAHTIKMETRRAEPSAATNPAVSIPPPEVTTGSQELICVTAIKAPNVVYGQLTKTDAKKIESLQIELNEKYDHMTAGEMILSDSSVGMSCTTRYSDGGWYRALITQKQRNTVSIAFADFGDETITQSLELKQMLPEFGILSQQCILCHFPRASPSNSKEMTEKLLLNKVIEVKLISKKDGIYPTYEVEFTSNMRNQGLAGKLEGSSLMGSKQPPRLPKSVAVNKEARVMTLNRGDGYSFLQVDSGCSEEVMVTHVVDPQHFHVQVTSMAKQLDTMMDKLQAHYASITDTEEALLNPYLGQPCIAKYTDDNSWYRAKISGLLNNGRAEVTFVDYGNTECLQRETLKVARQEFMELPAQAIFCGLFGVKAAQGFWSPEHIAQFEDIALDQNFTAVFQDYSGEAEDLYTVKLENHVGEDINLTYGTSTNSICSEQSDRKVAFGKGMDIKIEVQQDNEWIDHAGKDSHPSEGNRFGGRSGERGGSRGFGGGDRSGGSGFGGGNRSGGSGFGGDRSGGFGSGNRSGGNVQNRNTTEEQGFGNRFRDGNRGGGFGGQNRDEDRSSGGFGRSNDRGGGFGGQNRDQERGGGFGGKSNDRGGGFGGQNRDHNRGGGFGGQNRDQERSGGFGGRSNDRSSGFGGRSNDRGGGFGGQNRDDRGGGFGGQNRDQERGGGFGGRSNDRVGGYRGQNRDQNRGGGFGGQNRDQERGGGFGGRSNDRGGGFGGQNRDQNRGGGFGGQNRDQDRGGFGGRSNDRGGGFGGRSNDRGGGFSGGGFSQLQQTTPADDDWDTDVSTVVQEKPASTSAAPKSRFRGTSQTINTPSSLSSDQKSDAWSRRVGSVTFTSQKLIADTSCQVFVVYSNSPGEFWCQLVDKATELQSMMDQMNQHYNSLSPTMSSIDQPEIGMPCVAKFSEDELWYRAEISSFDDMKIEVQFIDYGNSEFVDLKSVKLIQKEFTSLPLQAIRCCLSGVKCSESKWSEKAIENFETLTADKELVCAVKSQVGGSYLVNLEDASGELDVALKLHEAGHCILAPVGSGKLQKVVAKVPYPALPISIGSKMEVYVSWIEDPSMFWVQPVENQTVLEELAQQVQEEYTSGPSADKKVPKISEGMAVIAKFSEDELWYRAVVESEGKTASVRFIDYGNTDSVALDSLRLPSASLMEVPAQAIYCSLADVKPLQPGNWNVDAKDIMESMVKEAVSCTFKETMPNGFSVDIVSDGIGVADELVRAAVVKKVSLESNKKPESPPKDVQISSGRSEAAVSQVSVKQRLNFAKNVALDNGSVEPAYVSQVNSISHFYIQLAKLAAQLEALMEKLDKACGTKSRPSMIVPGMACAAKFSGDEMWYRATVVQVNADDADVLFIDYGNSEVVSFNNICEISQDCLSLPPQAIQCSLKKCNEVTDASAVTKFTDMVMDKEVQIHVINAGSPTVVDISVEDTKSLSDLLNSKSSASASSPSMSKTLPAQSIPTNPNTKVFTSYVHSPSMLYLQQASQETNLNDLSTKLQTAYSASVCDISVQELKKGFLCCTMYVEDNLWYRAEIEEVRGDKCYVLFVDYGNSEEVETSSLKVLAPEFMTLPAMGFRCALDGLVPVKEKWSEDSIAHLESLVMDQELTCKFVSNTTVCLRNEDGDVGEDLVAQGYAKLAKAEELKFSQQGKPKGKVMTCVSHVEDVFYIQLSTDEDKLVELSENLQTLCEQRCTPKPEQILEGLHCCAKFSEDQAWYRATVSKVTGQKVAVRFLDFGNCDEVTCDQLKLLNEELLTPELLAYPAVIKGVGRMTEEQQKLFSSLTEDQELTTDFLEMTDDGLYQVTLTTSEGKDIGQELWTQKATAVLDEALIGDKSFITLDKTGYVESTLKGKTSSQVECEQDKNESAFDFTECIQEQGNRVPEFLADFCDSGETVVDDIKSLRSEFAGCDMLDTFKEETGISTEKSSEEVIEGFGSMKMPRKDTNKVPHILRNFEVEKTVEEIQLSEELEIELVGSKLATETYVELVDAGERAKPYDEPMEIVLEAETSNEPVKTVIQAEIYDGPVETVIQAEIYDGPVKTVIQAEIYDGPVETMKDAEIYDEPVEIVIDTETFDEPVETVVEAETSGEYMETVIEAETSDQPVETVIEAETSYQPLETVIEAETFDQPVETVIDTETFDEPVETVVDAETCNEPVETVVEAETSGEYMETVIEAETYDQPVETVVDTETFDEPVETVVDTETFDEPVETVIDKETYDEPVETVVDTETSGEYMETVIEAETSDQTVETVIDKKTYDEPVETVIEAETSYQPLETVIDTESSDESMETVIEAETFDQTVETVVDTEIYDEPVETVIDTETFDEPVETVIDTETFDEPVETVIDTETFDEPVEIVIDTETFDEPVETVVDTEISGEYMETVIEAETSDQPVETVIEAETSYQPLETLIDTESSDESMETVIETEISDQPVETMVDTETFDEPVETVVDTETYDEPVETVINTETSGEYMETVIDKETSDQTVETVLEAETSGEYMETVIEAETSDQTVETVLEAETSYQPLETVIDTESSDESMETVIEAETFDQTVETVVDTEIYDEPVETVIDTETFVEPVEIVIDTETFDEPVETVVDTETFGEYMETVIEAETSDQPVETVIEAETSYQPLETLIDTESSDESMETVIEAETSDQPVETVVDTETFDEPVETVVDTETFDEPAETAVDTETFDEPAETLVEAETSDEPVKNVIETETYIEPVETVIDTETYDEPVETKTTDFAGFYVNYPGISIDYSKSTDYPETLAKTSLDDDLKSVIAESLLGLEDADGTLTETSANECGDASSTETTGDLGKLTRIVLEEGDRVQVTCSHINSPSSFYVHLDRNKEALNTLCDEMFKLYSEYKGTDLNIESPKEGQVCAVQYSEDESWYRAKVLEVLGSDKFKVEFLDHGNTEECSGDMIRKLLTRFVGLPVQTMLCTLGGVRSADGPWSDEALELFSKLLGEKSLLADIMCVSDDNAYIVQLFDMGILLSQKFIDEGYGVEASTPTYISKKTKRVFSDSSPLKVVDLSGDVLAALEEDRYPSLELTQSMDYNCCVSHAVSPGKFWLQLSEKQEDLQKFMDGMQEKYSKDKPLTIEQVKCGIPCVSLYTEDGRWYRALVTDKHDMNVQVIFVDYGNSETVTPSELQEIQSEDILFPRQAFCCRMKGIIPESESGGWEQIACSRLEELTFEKDLKVNLCKALPNSCYEVEMSDGDICLADTLVQGGYARFSEGDNKVTVGKERMELSKEQIASDDSKDDEDFHSIKSDSVDKLDLGPFKPLKVNKDESYTAVILNIKSPGCFYILLEEPGSENRAELVTGIKQYVCDHSDEVLSSDEILIGTGCLARMEDGFYGRAVITEANDQNVEVYMVDLGLCHCVDSAFLKPIPSDMLDLPAQAITCSLADIQPIEGNEWSEDSISGFQALSSECDLVSLYVDPMTKHDCPPYNVTVNAIGAKEQMFNMQMVELGYADFVPGSTLESEALMDETEVSFNELSLLKENSIGSDDETDVDTSKMTMEESVLETTGASDSFSFLSGKQLDKIREKNKDETDDEFYDAENISKETQSNIDELDVDLSSVESKVDDLDNPVVKDTVKEEDIANEEGLSKKVEEEGETNSNENAAEENTNTSDKEKTKTVCENTTEEKVEEGDTKESSSESVTDDLQNLSLVDNTEKDDNKDHSHDGLEVNDEEIAELESTTETVTAEEQSGEELEKAAVADSETVESSEDSKEKLSEDQANKSREDKDSGSGHKGDQEQAVETNDNENTNTGTNRISESGKEKDTE